MSAALTAALDGVLGAQVAVLSVLGAVLAMAALTYGYRYVLKIISFPPA